MVDNTFLYDPAKPKTGSLFVNLIQAVVVALVVVVVFYLVAVNPNQVDGQSMEPNFYDKQFILTNKVVDRFGSMSILKSINYDYRRGDVVVFEKEGFEEAIIKRIIATPGERIKFENGSFYVNGKLLREDYIPDTPEYETELPASSVSTLREGIEVEVPPNSYFLVGDNRKHSQDSRFTSIGFVTRKEILGRVFLRLWPLDSLGFISKGKFEEI